MKPFLDLFIARHTHDTPDSSCHGNPVIIHEGNMIATLPMMTNVDKSDDRVTADMVDNGEVKHFVFERVFEDDDAMAVHERINFEPKYDMYSLSAEPDWEKIPDAIKNDPEQLKGLENLQGQVDSANTVLNFLNDSGIINVKVSDEGIIGGYDLTTFTNYFYTPVKDSLR